MQLSADPNSPTPDPLPRALLDRIGTIAYPAIFTLIWLTPAAWLIWALGIVFVVLLQWARRRSVVAELERASDEAVNSLIGAAACVLQTRSTPPDPHQTLTQESEDGDR